MAEIADVVTSQGVVAAIAWQPTRVPSPPDLVTLLERSRGAGVLCLDRVSDPGNAGTLVRTAVAFGLEAVLLGSGSVAATNPKFLRASAGTAFSLDILADQVGLPAVIDALAGRGWQVLAADAAAGAAPDRLQRAGSRWLLVLGSEAHGLTDAVAAACAPVHIPLAGPAESLNVAVAGGILLHALVGPAGPRRHPEDT
jgi:TrmH family RNA methyltransferase